MTERFPQGLKSLEDVLLAAKEHGERTTRHNVWLVGRARHIGPEAWLHSVPPGLGASGIAALQGRFGRLPADYIHFLETCNGIGLFGDSLSVFGIRPQSGRDVDSAFLPYDLIEANATDRPDGLGSDFLVVGSYSFDGSLVVLSLSAGSVLRMDRDSDHVYFRWPTFFTFLSSECARLAQCFDDKGNELVPQALLGPVDKRRS